MIVVIDYGMGNLRSVSKALEHLGANVTVSSDPQVLERAQKVVLPGVGAFGDAVRELHRAGLFDPLTEYIRRGGLFMGICLGLQLLFEESEESPGVKGLGIFPGKVQRFRSTDVKVPHMGWNQVSITKAHPAVRGLEDGSYFYFVHSYYAPADATTPTVGQCVYGSEAFSAMIGTDTLFAAQFHPEKSQQAGLKILKNFAEWNP
ncbi:MAG: imidazole glycerol phosphate synthase subunit HisH [Candidatus Omnitrophica bacterium]|nr:imidazole glycerol phosphate synthase subunit HisH [Candidatus Omnitrophota bacterium]